ncbi:hypothetical protein CALVIDRAFT_534097 [Calocera viscosa TUFC12733]|uniref:Iron-sulfur assembly protein 1 n=1 Tax=Calocera viscosa (strain TUFC12733) TaxID=1330018 RepID=A0A167QEA5_CALVF|nr:hypothetical protein CALVIDRAFT_534097 [Calocera viscosa TUFC12733]
MQALLTPRTRPSYPFLLPLTHSRPRPSLFFTPHRSETTLAPSPRAGTPGNSLGSSATPIPGEREETPPVVEEMLKDGPGRAPPAPVKRRPIRSSKAAISMTPTAVSRLRSLLHSPTPTHLRIGVRQKGCAGMSYHLEYVPLPGPFDEVVEQDGVRVLIDSKALFSIIGSEMDWREDLLSSKFVFKNPNIKDACGCGESFNVGQSIQL